MRQPEVGQIVLWYPEGERGLSPHPAVVTAVGQHALTLNILGPDYRNFRVEGGVHHVDDPVSRREFTKESGGWDFTPRDKRLDAIVEAFGEAAQGQKAK